MTGWETASTAAGRFDGVPGDDDVAWRRTELPARGADDEDHWFRCSLAVPDGGATLRLGGLATVCDVFLDGSRVLDTRSMFLAYELSVAGGDHELAIRARALTPILAESRRPRARWRTRVASNDLRWLRTSLFGRAPGFATGPPIVGPWRPVELLDETHLPLAVTVSLDGQDGVVEIRCPDDAGPLEVSVGAVAASLPPGGGKLRVPEPSLWWPHTHGEPVLHELHVRAGRAEAKRRIGFRRLAAGADVEHDGLSLSVNGVPVFVRGAIWTPAPRAEVLPTLRRARDGGMNMVRVVGTMVYEDAEFHDACDELGLLVWQDLMFANMDYPFVDDAFRALAEDEVRQVSAALAGRPSSAVLCGNSEIEQQVSMLGLPVDLARSDFFVATSPRLAREAGCDAAYLASAPTGGALPFRTDRGVANYFGVGAYLRPLTDVRRAAVRFASECLAFANVPDEDPAERETGVMRDVGATWDFADVRDHYLGELRGVDTRDPDYWEEARAVTGGLMAATFGEWRRAASPSAGGLVLWLRDLAPGSGWGVLDHEGRPKLAWYQLRRALQPVAVWLVDEGLNGLSIHVANDTGERLDANLRLALYRDQHVSVATTDEALHLEPHTCAELDAEALLGGFADITYAYRFGEPQHDTVVATLEREAEVLSQAFFYPMGMRRERRSADELGLAAAVRAVEGDRVQLELEANSLVRGIRLESASFEPADSGFDLEPGHARRVELRPLGDGGRAGTVRLTALNLLAPLEVAAP